MKKTLLTLIATVLSSAVALAGEYSISLNQQGYENAQDVTSFVIGNVTATLSKGTNSNGPKYYNTGESLRLYGGNSISFASTETIVSIQMTITGGKAFNPGTTATVGQLSDDFASWTGSVNEVTITNGGTSGHARIQTITVTTTESGETYVPAPHFSLAEGTYYEPQTLELTAAEGLTISYTLNGGTEQAYTAPIQLSDLGTYTLAAYCTDNGGNKSETATRTYTIAQAQGIATLAELRDATTATSQNDAPEVNFTANDILVSYASGVYTFITDGKYGYLLYGTQTALKTGDRFSGLLTGKPYIYNGLREMSVTDGFANVQVTSSGNQVAAADFSYDNLVYDRDESLPFIIKNAKFAAAQLTSRQVTILDSESNELAAYDRFDILKNAGFNTDDTYNISGFITRYGENVQFYVYALQNLSGEEPQPQPGETIANTPETAYTVAQAIQLTDAGQSLSDSVYVKGIVSKTGSFNSNYGQMNIWIKDSSDDTTEFEAYNCLGLMGEKFTSAADINVGDTIIVKGTLTKYNSTYELARGCYIYSRKAVELKEYTPTGEGTQENPYTVADIIALATASNKPTEKVWVSGTILGNVNSQSGATIVPDAETPAVATNLSLGNADDGTHISIQLPQGDVRTLLNILDNPANLGKTVSVYGSIDTYCGITGLRNVTDCVVSLSIDDLRAIISSYVGGGNAKMNSITKAIENISK